MDNKTIELLSVAEIIDSILTGGVVSEEVLNEYNQMLESSYEITEDNAVHKSKLPLNLVIKYSELDNVASNVTKINEVFNGVDTQLMTAIIESLVSMKTKSYADITDEIAVLDTNYEELDPFYKNVVLVELLSYSIANNLGDKIRQYNNAIKANRQEFNVLISKLKWEYVNG